MATARMTVSPEILTWAVERLGQNVSEYSMQNECFKDWLNGSVKPTFKQVQNFAKKFYLPLGYMFLQEPPIEQPPITFFRKTVEAKQNINVDETVELLSERQVWLSNYLKTNEYPKLEFVGKFKNAQNKDIESICNYAKKILNLNDNWAFGFYSEREAINKLVSVLEDVGIITVFNGVVGNNTQRPIDVNACRGFALVDDYAPFIFVNAKDVKVAQMFTLIHEMAHILIGYTAGISDMDINDNKISIEERLCNKIATNFLLPKNLFIDMWNKNKDIKSLSQRFKVSRYVIGIRAVELNLLSQNEYNKMCSLWKKESYETANQKKGGGNFYTNAIRRTSRTFLIHVVNALNEQQILHTEAYRLSGLKGDNFHNVINSEYFLQ